MFFRFPKYLRWVFCAIKTLKFTSLCTFTLPFPRTPFIRRGRIIYTKVNRIIPCKIFHFFRMSSCFDIDLLFGIIEVIPRGMNIRMIILIYRPKMDIQNPGCKKNPLRLVQSEVYQILHYHLGSLTKRKGLFHLFKSFLGIVQILRAPLEAQTTGSNSSEISENLCNICARTESRCNRIFSFIFNLIHVVISWGFMAWHS